MFYAPHCKHIADSFQCLAHLGLFGVVQQSQSSKGLSYDIWYQLTTILCLTTDSFHPSPVSPRQQ